MSTPEERLRIGKQIVDWEARRDSEGRIKVYQLPEGDGGGKYEVAGINDKYHPQEAKMLKDLVESGKHSEAEKLAATYIATYTDNAASWTSVTAIEAFLRDCAFNRGSRGAALIYQIALGVKVDGIVGEKTLTAARQAEAQPEQLLQDLREAREKYERRSRDESSKFWRGLVNRWNKALTFSLSFL